MSYLIDLFELFYSFEFLFVSVILICLNFFLHLTYSSFILFI